jgi:hypothetical protein
MTVPFSSCLIVPSTVHVTTAVSGQLVAMGQVTYRLLEPWPGRIPGDATGV